MVDMTLNWLILQHQSQEREEAGCFAEEMKDRSRAKPERQEWRMDMPKEDWATWLDS